MRQLTDSIEINAPPEPIWEWLAHLPEHYTEWHPDHVSASWERGEPNRVGSILRAVEIIGGETEVLRFEMTSIEAPKRLEYRIRGPISVLLPRGAFTVIPDDDNAIFTASIRYRFGRLAERLFKHRVAALTKHMREEGESLKRIIESSM